MFDGLNIKRAETLGFRPLYGAAGVNRTRDPFLTKEVLYH